MHSTSEDSLWGFGVTRQVWEHFMIHDGLFLLKMLQIAESFIHLTFSTIVYYFHESFE